MVALHIYRPLSPLLLGMLLHTIMAEQRIVLQPLPSSVVLGDAVTLRCRVAGQEGTVQWSKNGFALGTERSLPEYARYRMTGSSTDGDFNLEISQASLMDEANYQCQMGQTDRDEGKLSDTVFLTVLVPPSAPVIVNYGDVITTELDKEYTIVCESEGGKPAPDLSWVVAKDVGGRVVVRKVQTVKSTATAMGEFGQLFAVKSVLSYIPHKADNGHYLVCLVKHPALEPKMLETAAQLRVHYKPEISVKMLTSNASSNKRPQEGGDVALVCEVLDGSPQSQLRYSWKKAGVEVGTSDQLFLRNLTKDLHHRAEFVCEVTNEVGSSTASHVVMIEYGPRIERLSKPVVRVDKGRKAVLKCRVDSSPPADVVWKREGSKDIIFRGQNLIIPQVSSKVEGKYWCSAEIPGFPPARQSFQLFINGAPSVSMLPKLEAGRGESVQLWCRVKGEPAPTNKIVWYKRHSCKDDGQWIPLKDTLTNEAIQRYNFGRPQPSDGSHDRVLHIRNVLRDDFGCYNCTVSNRYGSGDAFVELAEGEFLPLYYIIPLGIISAVIVLALCICALCFNRRALCRSTKSSNPADDRDSDVVVKCESMDGSGVPLQRYYPDMYATSGSDPPEYNRKEYMPVPVSDHQDFDNLPPPYPSANYYTSNMSPPTTFASNGSSTSNGHLVHMTYLDDSPQAANVSPLLTSSGSGEHPRPPLIAPQPIYSASDYSMAHHLHNPTNPNSPHLQHGIVGLHAPHPVRPPIITSLPHDVYQTGSYFSNDAIYLQHQHPQQSVPNGQGQEYYVDGGGSVHYNPVTSMGGGCGGPPTAVVAAFCANGSMIHTHGHPQSTSTSPNHSSGGGKLTLGFTPPPTLVTMTNGGCFENSEGMILSPPSVSCAPLLGTLHEVTTPETPGYKSAMRVESQLSTHV